MKKILLSVLVFSCFISQSWAGLFDSLADFTGVRDPVASMPINDQIRKACVPGDCGYMKAVKKVVPAATAVKGTVLGSRMGIPGAIVGGVTGYLIGENVGGKFLVDTANEYIKVEGGGCLECDTYQMGAYTECPHTTVVSNGLETFKCVTTGTGDYWRETSLPLCSNSPIKGNVKNYVAEIHATVAVRVGDRVAKYSPDACYYLTCGEGKLNKAGTECIMPDAEKDEVKKPKNVPSCVDSRTTPEGKACCSLHSSVAKWENGQCVCVGQNQEFSYDGLQGYCNVKGEENASHQCDDSVWVTISAWKVQCKASQDVLEAISKFEALCEKSDLTVGKFNETRAAVQDLVNAMCTKSDEVTVVVEEAMPVDTSASRKAILAAENVLKNIESGFKVSVWKDEEGKFNTARLASDSIAGVVLGTAGGLITSSVIKKHQIEDGFEDINCVIGGQSVAGWGDEFSVGVQ